VYITQPVAIHVGMTMSDHSHLSPELQEIIEMFAEAEPRDRVSMLLDFSEQLPDLPPDLAAKRDEMEQVHECQSPVFLHTHAKEGRIYYDIDIPKEAPTVRGFASILHQGLNGATPEAIAATPLDLYAELGLDKVLSHQRLNGLTALLSYMKRNAAKLAV
jgi:cysteine desulfuration protein SufE